VEVVVGNGSEDKRLAASLSGSALERCAVRPPLLRGHADASAIDQPNGNAAAAKAAARIAAAQRPPSRGKRLWQQPLATFRVRSLACVRLAFRLAGSLWPHVISEDDISRRAWHFLLQLREATSLIHANNYSMEVRSDPLESAKSHLFDTSSWESFCDVTLTLKQARQSERGAWIKIDDYACRQAFATGAAAPAASDHRDGQRAPAQRILLKRTGPRVRSRRSYWARGLRQNIFRNRRARESAGVVYLRRLFVRRFAELCGLVSVLIQTSPLSRHFFHRVCGCLIGVKKRQLSRAAPNACCTLHRHAQCELPTRRDYPALENQVESENAPNGICTN
jgi:hypothetical protein